MHIFIVPAVLCLIFLVSHTSWVAAVRKNLASYLTALPSVSKESFQTSYVGKWSGNGVIFIREILKISRKMDQINLPLMRTTEWERTLSVMAKIVWYKCSKKLRYFMKSCLNFVHRQVKILGEKWTLHSMYCNIFLCCPAYFQINSGRKFCILHALSNVSALFSMRPEDCPRRPNNTHSFIM